MENPNENTVEEFLREWLLQLDSLEGPVEFDRGLGGRLGNSDPPPATAVRVRMHTVIVCVALALGERVEA